MPTRHAPAAVVVVPGVGLAAATAEGAWTVPAAEPAAVVAELSESGGPRWVFWSARTEAAPLVAADVRPRTCWDLAAVHRLLHGGRRDDPPAVWAAVHGLPEPAPPRRGEPTLLDLAEPEPDDRDDALAPDGRLRSGWQVGGSLDRAARWAVLALEAHQRQERALRALPDPRPRPGEPPLAVLTAHAESAAALLAVELERDGLPVDRPAAEALLARMVGPRPADAAAEQAARDRRDALVLQHFPGGEGCDLRNPAQVRALLARAGIDLPDTRSWRLEPFRGSHPGVAALLAWRKAERVATTYGYGWLDRHVGPDGRLRGAWGASDGGAGRMTAQAGLHNLPAELRSAVVAEPGHLLVRADLGQVEPRVLATVSGDAALAAATRADDLYAPVAAQLACDRPTAKVAVLAAMYGQTSGPAGAALRRMERAYPQALRFLRDAEEAGRLGRDLRTWGGRLLPLSRLVDDDGRPHPGRGRFARNAVVQGAAAELFKAWAATVRGALPPLGGRIVLCLHDELLLHVPRERADDAARLLTDALASTADRWAGGSGVRFVADVGQHVRWSDAKH